MKLETLMVSGRGGRGGVEVGNCGVAMKHTIVQMLLSFPLFSHGSDLTTTNICLQVC